MKNSKQGIWEMYRESFSDLEKARNFVAKHDMLITKDEFDRFELEWRENLEELPDVNEREIILEFLRDMYRQAKEQLRDIWIEYDNKRALGVSLKERQKWLKDRRGRTKRFLVWIENKAKDLEVRSLSSVVTSTTIAHAKENPEAFIRRNYFLFICN